MIVGDFAHDNHTGWLYICHLTNDCWTRIGKLSKEAAYDAPYSADDSGYVRMYQQLIE